MKREHDQANQDELQEQEMNFEEAMMGLEEIVSKLEHGDVPLEQAIDLFQQGMHLSRLCSQKLEQVEQRIEMISVNDGEIIKKPMRSPSEESGDSLE